MPPRNLQKDALALKAFKRKKVLLVDELAKLLASSIGTARRRLKEWGTSTSYNFNGRYYVLNHLVEFDHNGLWRYKTVLFSQHGTLKSTVVHLVTGSPAGLTASEIGKLVRLAPRSFLSHFRNEPQLQRETIQSRFVYFSSNKTVGDRQKQRRLDQIARAALIRIPTDAEAVIILVERMKHMQLTIKDLSTRLRKKGYHFSAEEISNFLGAHELLKKTPDTQP